MDVLMAYVPFVKFVLDHDYAVLPEYKTEGAAGFDFYSVEDVVIQPGQIKQVALGLKCEVESGYELQIRCRSSLGRNGLILPHGIGTVDCDYRGPLSVPVANISNGTQFISIGDRVAQGVVAPAIQANIIEVEENELSETSRGQGGFGSTGR